MDKNRAPGAAESRAVNACLTKSHDGPLCGSDYCHQFGKQAEREEAVSLAGMGFLESSPVAPTVLSGLVGKSDLHSV